MSLTYRSIKGSTLTSDEADENILYLDTKIDTTAATIPDVATSQAVFTQTSTVTVTNTTATLFGTGVGSLTIPADTLSAGSTIRIVLMGLYDSGATPSLTITASLGGFSLGGTHNLAANQTFNGFEIDCIITCRTSGSGGTLACTLKTLSKEDDTTGLPRFFLNLNTGSLDTTISNVLNITATAGSTETIRIYTAAIDQLN